MTIKLPETVPQMFLKLFFILTSLIKFIAFLILTLGGLLMACRETKDSLDGILRCLLELVIQKNSNGIVLFEGCGAIN